MRVQGLTRGRGNVVDTGEIRLRKRRAGCRYWCNISVNADAEGRGGVWCGGAAESGRGIGRQRPLALHGLDEASAQQRHQHQVHAIQTSVDPVIPAADNALAMSECFIQESTVEVRAPGNSNTRAERAIERVVRILG